jgi:hypothetical protein
LEYSQSSNEAVFTVIYRPELASCSIKNTNVANMGGTVNSFVKSSVISFSLSGGSVKTVMVYIR